MTINYVSDEGHTTYFDGHYQMGTNSLPEFEVGWSYKGIPTAEQKKAALQELLDLIGNDLKDWHLAPQIRLVEAGASVGNFGRGPIFIAEDSWAVYGIATKEPKYGRLYEGQYMTAYEDLVK